LINRVREKQQVLRRTISYHFKERLRAHTVILTVMMPVSVSNAAGSGKRRFIAVGPAFCQREDLRLRSSGEESFHDGMAW
jgi:hypothetical protein